MLKRIFIFIWILGLVGCAMTQKNTQVSQLNMQVQELQRELEFKDDEIRNLKYEVEDLNTQLSRQSGAVVSEVKIAPIESTGTSSRSKSTSQTDKKTGYIRVPVDTKTIQRALQNAGFYDYNIDGKIGTLTKSAIREFQKAHDLKSDGIIGQKTWSELKLYLD